MSDFHSKILNDLIQQFASLPSIGKKSALRLALHMVKQNDEKLDDFIQALVSVKQDLMICKRCNNIADDELCSICSDPRRKSEVLCVVEGIRDLLAIEETGQYQGKYFVLDGLISPIEGRGPDDINLDQLMDILQNEEVGEIIMAISPSFEGDTTAFYISKLLKDFDIKITTLARGVAFGGDLEYTDEITLGRSLLSRVPYENVFNKSS